MAVESFKIRSDLHLARKIWHVLAVLFIAVVYHNVGREQGLRLLAVYGGFFIIGDILRLRIEAINKVAIAIFKPFLRKHELNSIAGTTYLISGVFLIILFFPPQIVKLTLLFLAVGDPVASFFGVKFGKQTLFGKKTLEGSVGAFLACFLIALPFLHSEGVALGAWLAISLLAGVVGALSELIPIGKIDDNFTFPIISAILLYGLAALFNGWNLI